MFWDLSQHDGVENLCMWFEILCLMVILVDCALVYFCSTPEARVDARLRR